MEIKKVELFIATMNLLLPLTICGEILVALIGFFGTILSSEK
jgi:hypothetical protein